MVMCDYWQQNLYLPLQLFIAIFVSVACTGGSRLWIWRRPNWAETTKALRIEAHVAIWHALGAGAWPLTL